MLTGFVFTRDYAESIIAVRAHTKMHKNNARCDYTIANDPLLYKTNACTSDYGCCDSFSLAYSLQRSYLTMAKRCRTEWSACESHKLILMPALHYSKCLIEASQRSVHSVQNWKKAETQLSESREKSSKNNCSLKADSPSMNPGFKEDRPCSEQALQFLKYGFHHLWDCACHFLYSKLLENRPRLFQQIQG